MNKIPKHNMSRSEWVALRKNSVGGSEAAILMGLDDYKCAGELYAEKVGIVDPPDIDNQYMFWGRQLEDVIARTWQYYDPTLESEEETIYNMIQNEEANAIQRKSIRNNFILYHPDYSYISANVDREIVGTDKGKGILECKTISGYHSDKWEAGIPPKYLVQLQHYLWVTGYTWGELAVLRDGREFSVYHFERNETIIESIRERIVSFWVRVEAGRSALEKGGNAYEFEPQPDESPAWTEYLSARFKGGDTTMIESNHDDIAIVEEILKYQQTSKGANEVVEINKNKLKYRIGDLDGIDFGSRGKITWKRNSKGSRVFYIGVK